MAPPPEPAETNSEGEHRMTQQFAERAVNVAPTGARNADLSDLVRILEDGQHRKLDVIAPASALRMQEGNVRVEGVESQLTTSGVTQVDGIYRPTAVADEGISDKLRIPLAYLRRMRAENVPLLDDNVNSWLREEPGRGSCSARSGATARPARPPARAWRVRCCPTATS